MKILTLILATMLSEGAVMAVETPSALDLLKSAAGGVEVKNDLSRLQRPVAVEAPQNGGKVSKQEAAVPIGPVPGLSQSGDLPLPSLGPDSDGAFRPAVGYTEGGSFSSAQAGPAGAPGELRVMQWNASRGEQLDKLLEVIKKANPDVLILSETDLYGKIAKGKVTAREIASALGYSYYTASEFGELRDDRRGSSGNAIVSRYPLSGGKFTALPIMKGEGGYDWADDGGQPRTGQRNSISAYIEAPGKGGKSVRINLVSMHTENKANAKVRLAQFETAVKALTIPGEPTILAGDLNTISIGEGGSFRNYLKKVSLIDCSSGNNQGTHMLNMRLDWVILQPGAENALVSKSYHVINKEGASDHSPIIADFQIK